jgi:hypothetical protein
VLEVMLDGAPAVFEARGDAEAEARFSLDEDVCWRARPCGREEGAP